MKILAITQARYGSTRLPAKILKKVNGMTLLEIHLRRILQSKLISKLKVATTNEEGAGYIVAVADKLGVECYKGSVDDVLERFYKAAEPECPDYVVRLTSDCPLIDPAVIDAVIQKCLESGCDYVSNVLEPTFPDGIDTEVFRFPALKRAYEEATLKSEREHVTPYLCRHFIKVETFRIHRNRFKLQSHSQLTRSRKIRPKLFRKSIATPISIHFIPHLYNGSRVYSYSFTRSGIYFSLYPCRIFP